MQSAAQTARAGILAAMLWSIGFALPAVAAGPAPDTTAQAGDRFEQDRKRLVADNLPLTESEARQFWPIYAHYQKELSVLVERRKASLTRFGENYEDLPDALARQAVIEHIEIQETYFRLVKAYLPKFEKVLPAKKLLRYYQIEAKIRAAVDAGIAERIPLIQ